MSDGSVDAEVIDAINQAMQAAMQPQILQASATGKAYQMVAQSCALAVQDAVDSLRNVNMLADAAAAAALSQYVASGDDSYQRVLEATMKMRTQALEIYGAATAAAAAALKDFPSD
jgi:hypothetical protein